MPTTPVTPTSDITTTGWTPNSGTTFWDVLAANGGTNFVFDNFGSTGDPTKLLTLGSTFSTSGMSAITNVAYSVHWKNTAKAANADFKIILLMSGGGSILADMSAVTTGNTSGITSTGNLTIESAGSTLSNWPTFQIQIASGTLPGDTCVGGCFFGLSLTVTYTGGSPPADTQQVVMPVGSTQACMAAVW